jgi:hypothetical protein
LEQAQYPAKRYGSPFYEDLDKAYTQVLLDLAKGSANVDQTMAALKEQGQKIVDDYWASAS